MKISNDTIWNRTSDLQMRSTTVEFYSKNKFEKLVHLVGFIIRIYHDARSSECQINLYDVANYCLICNEQIGQILGGNGFGLGILKCMVSETDSVSVIW
jgi:hypothetical protein